MQMEIVILHEVRLRKTHCMFLSYAGPRLCRTMNACAGHERRKGMMGKEENIEKGDL